MLRRFLWGLCTLAVFVAPHTRASGGEGDLAAAVADAFGGQERLASLAGFRIVADVEGLGLEGRSTVWFAFPDRQRSELDLGPLSLLLVIDGPRAWHRDHNGAVVQLDPHQIADARTSLFIDAYGPWLAPPETSGLRILGEEELDGRPHTLVEITPPGGNPAQLWIDRGSSLPTRMSQADESGLGHDVVHMSDYRPVGGIQVPFHLESFNDQLPENRSVYRLREVVWDAPGDEGLFAPPLEQADVTFPPGVTSLTLPLTVEARHLFVRGHMVGRGTGEDGLFLLDTATTLSMLDRGMVDRLGLETDGQLKGLAVGGTMDIALVQLPFLKIGGVYMEDQVLGVTDLSAVGEQMGLPVAGLLGYDFFSRLVVTLDYSGQCTLHHGNTWRVPDGGVTLPVRFMDQQPTVRASLDGSFVGDWRLDTGADALTVHGPAAEAWGLRERHGDGFEIGAHGMGGETASRVLQADRFQIGPYAVDRPSLIVPNDPEGVLRAEGTVGNLGNSVLERFTVTVDFSGQRVHLQPGPRAGSQLSVHTADFDIGWVGTDVQVLWVLPGGDAEGLGLRAGQRVLRIDGRRAAAWSEGELNWLWAGEGPRSVGVVLREGRGRRRVDLEIPMPP